MNKYRTDYGLEDKYNIYKGSEVFIYDIDYYDEVVCSGPRITSITTQTDVAVSEITKFKVNVQDKVIYAIMGSGYTVPLVYLSRAKKKDLEELKDKIINYINMSSMLDEGLDFLPINPNPNVTFDYSLSNLINEVDDTIKVYRENPEIGMLHDFWGSFDNRADNDTASE